jgi:hypothetical protein
MKYPTPNGSIIESSPLGTVTATFPQVGMIVGTYDSIETQSSNNAFGIEQIKIHRVITDTSITISITEATDEELQTYLDSINPPVQDVTDIPLN